MDPAVVLVGQLAAIAVLTVGSLCAIGIFTSHALHDAKRKVRKKLSADDERLEQLQQSVDAIAVEVERIAEAQRFTAKLLAERAESQALPPLMPGRHAAGRRA